MPGKNPSDDLLTTGQCAKIAQCAPRTIAGWIDSGRLKGFRLPGMKATPGPGGRDRRVNRRVFLDFLRGNGYPVDGDGVLATNPPVLVFGQSEAVVAGLAVAFATAGVGVTALPTDTVVDWLRFGMLYRDLKPCAVVLDDSCGVDAVRGVAEALAASDRPPFVVLFRDPSADLVAIPGVRMSFHTPADPADIVRVVVRGK